MLFHEIRFPANLSFGSVGGPQRRTNIVTLANGYEERNTPWAHSLRHFDAGVGLRSLDDLGVLIAFFEARRGELYGFRWKDWSDYKSGPASRAPDFGDQIIAMGDGETRSFQLSKLYRSGEQSYRRPITKPVAGSLRLALDGVPQIEGLAYSVDSTTGIVTFADPPEIDEEITAGFEFDMPVRFDTDRIEISVANFNAGDVPRVPVIEVRL